uniref:Sulfotransferase n=1 Tax=Pyxicephalus adspersus TaxID=30357 RepID=A0AAV3AIH0_PYXAD|nr:TPA: hypothetical protein GDO54_011054 [Pyxicephalus adspersus]
MLKTVTKTSAEDLLFNYNGILYPSTVCWKETLDALETFEAMDDDLLIVSYPKCGTNWVIQIIYEMVSLTKNQETLLDQPVLEYGNPQLLQKLKERPPPRIISSYLPFQMIPKSFFKKKAKILLVIRNPKDTAISYFNFYKTLPALPTYTSWNVFFTDFIHGNVCYGSYFDYVAEWNKHIDEDNVMAVTFEDMKTDFPGQLKKISEFYRLPLTEEQICVIQSRTSFTSMKDNSENTHGKFVMLSSEKVKRILNYYFCFLTGQVGDWKSLFTEDQSKDVDEIFQQHLAGTKLGDLLNYTKYCKL